MHPYIYSTYSRFRDVAAGIHYPILQLRAQLLRYLRAAPPQRVPNAANSPLAPPRSPGLRRTQVFLRSWQGRAADEVAPGALLDRLRAPCTPAPFRGRQAAIPTASEGAAGAAGRESRQSVVKTTWPACVAKPFQTESPLPPPPGCEDLSVYLEISLEGFDVRVHSPLVLCRTGRWSHEGQSGDSNAVHRPGTTGRVALALRK